jgi:hypothetical protein
MTEPLPTPGRTLAHRYVVLAAYDAWLDRRGALKLLLPSQDEAGGLSDLLGARLEREALGGEQHSSLLRQAQHASVRHRQQMRG